MPAAGGSAADINGGPNAGDIGGLASSLITGPIAGETASG
jgi:hypothetical protein